MRTLSLVAVLAGALLAAPSAPPATAQQAPGGALLVVTVHDAVTGAPLAGAQVTAGRRGAGGLTDAQGSVQLRDLAPGRTRVHASYVGYAADSMVVVLVRGEEHTVAFTLLLAPVALPAVDARASPSTRRLAHTGFYERKAVGIGQFVTRQQIEERRPRVLSDVLRTIPGLRFTPGNFIDSHASMQRASPGLGRRCPIQYYIDGVPAHGYNIDDMPARDVEGIEIYRGASEVPPEFNRRTAMCGVIVIWTRIH